MEITDKTLEEMLARGEIIDMGEVEIEDIEIPVDVEEMEIPVHVAEDEAIDQRMIPELVVYTGKAENKQQPVAQEPAAKQLFTYFAKADNTQKRLRNLADYLFPEQKISDRIANAFGRTTEKDRIRAFGAYLADSIGSNGYVNPAQFLVKAEIALMNLKSGNNSGKPIRNSIKTALVEKSDKVYDSIRQKLPEIARAVTTTGFALELCELYSNALRAGKSPFEYARDIKRERQLDELARQANYELYR